MNTQKVTVFDMDDTLYPEIDYARSGLQSVGAFLEEEHHKQGIAEALIQLLEAGHRHTLFNQVLPQFDLSLELIPSLVKMYREHTPKISLYEDAIPSIQRARSIGPIGLISDGPLVCQKQKVKALNLEPQFDWIGLTDQWGRESWKPSPVVFQSLMKQFPNASYCYVGDNPEKDFVAPNQLGWTTFHLVRKDSMYKRSSNLPKENQAHHTIHTLLDMFEIW